MSKELINEKVIISSDKGILFGMNVPKEDTTRDRHHFVNRKQDRFTISTRFYSRGVNHLNNKWEKWRTLYSLSFTLKIPAGVKVKEPRLNIFYTGYAFGSFSNGVKNITRSPITYLNSLVSNSDFTELLISELQDLYRRTTGKPCDISVSTLEDDLKRLAYPSFKYLQEDFSGKKEIPLFAADVLRNKDAVSFSRALFTKDKEVAVEFLNHTDTLSVKKLGFLLMSRSIINDKERFEKIVLGSFIPLQKQERWQYRQLSFVDKNMSYDDLLIMRRFLKYLPREARMNVLLSLSHHSDLLLQLKAWNNDKSVINGIDYTFIKSWDDVYTSIDDALGRIKEKREGDVSLDDISKLLSKIFGEEFVENKNFRNETTSFQMGVSYYTINEFQQSIKLPVRWGWIDPNSLVVSIIQSDIYTPYKPIMEQKKSPKSPSIDLSYSAFYYLYSKLQEQAIIDLEKHKMDPNEKNVRSYIDILLHTSFEYGFARYKGKIPSPFYRLQKIGMSKKRMLFMLKYKVPVYNALEMNDVPFDWLPKMIGLKEEHDTSF